MLVSPGAKIGAGVLSIVSTPVATIVAAVALLVLKVKAVIQSKFAAGYAGVKEHQPYASRAEHYRACLKQTNHEILQWKRALIPFVGVYWALNSTSPKLEAVVDYTGL